MPQSHYRGQNVWILKATGFNRGVGIHIFNKVEQLNKLLLDYCSVFPHEKEREYEQLRLCIQHT